MELSLVIPCYNEIENLKLLLNRLRTVFYSEYWEIILVDNGSTDNTQKILKGFISNNKKKEIEYLLIDLDFNQGKGKALKEGIKFANKNWVLTLDTDISVSITQASLFGNKLSNLNVTSPS